MELIAVLALARSYLLVGGVEGNLVWLQGKGWAAYVPSRWLRDDWGGLLEVLRAVGAVDACLLRRSCS